MHHFVIVNKKVYDSSELFHCISQCMYKVLSKQQWCGVDPFNMTECSVAVCEKDEEGDKVGSRKLM